MNVLKNKWLVGTVIFLLVFLLVFKFKEPIKHFFGGYTTTKSGLKYKFIRGGKLEKMPEPGSMVLLKTLLISPNGDTVQSNFGETDTFSEYPYPFETNNLLLEAVNLMSPESKAEFLIKTDELKKFNNANPKIKLMPSGSNAKIILYEKSILTDSVYKLFVQKKQLQRTAIEATIVDNFIAKQKGTWLLDSLMHYRYKITMQGEGAKIDSGKTVSFDLLMQTLDGALIRHTQMEGNKITTVIGNQEFIPGVELCLQRIKNGGEIEAVLSSKTGYGAHPPVGIKPYAQIYIKIYNVQAK